MQTTNNPLRSRFGRAGSAAGLLLLVGHTANGYRFFGEVLVPEAEEAQLWNDHVWGAGSELQWTIADDPGWTSEWTDYWGETRPPAFGATRDAEPFIAAALAAWSAIGSADIRWRLTSVRPGPGAVSDGRNDITVDGERATAVGGVGFAQIWSSQQADGSWTISECDIVLTEGSAELMASDRPASLFVLLHELGHCIGLSHAAEHSRGSAWNGLPSAWGLPPMMSYGQKVSNDLTVDDIVGASLLRPATGWISRVGSVSGRITVAGRPARQVQVMAGRLDGTRVRPGPGSFTDETGYFLVEGLSPGRYLLRAGPLVSERAHPSLLEAGAVRKAKDGLRLDEVVVRANEETTGVEIEIEAGREPTRWRTQ